MQSSVASNANSNPTTSVGELDIVILGEGSVSYESNVGNFIIPGLTATMNQGATQSSQTPKSNAKNIINNDTNNFGLTTITTSNFIQIAVPKYMFEVLEVKCNGEGANDTIVRKTYSKGQKFLCAYLGQNREKPMIIGVIE